MNIRLSVSTFLVSILSLADYNDLTPGGVALPRTEMLDVLLDRLAPDNTPFLSTYFSKRLTSYEQTADGVTIHFKDGTTAQADILIGADGIGSAARKKMYTDLARQVQATDPQAAEALEKHSLPSWTGTYAYRTLVDRAKIEAVSPNNEILRGGRAVCESA
jgi:salicylate hydroxylase